MDENTKVVLLALITTLGGILTIYLNRRFSGTNNRNSSSRNKVDETDTKK